MKSSTTAAHRSVDGVGFRYTAGEMGLVEQTLRDDGIWESHGVSSILVWDITVPSLSQKNKQKYDLPESEETSLFQEKLLVLCKQCGVQVVFKYHPRGDNNGEVIIAAPSGDYILFKGRRRSIEEKLLSPEGWITVGNATSLIYSPNCRGLVDQNGGGGVLPKESLDDLLLSLQQLATMSGVAHDTLVNYNSQRLQFQRVSKFGFPTNNRRSSFPPPFISNTRHSHSPSTTSLTSSSVVTSSLDDNLSDIKYHKITSPPSEGSTKRFSSGSVGSFIVRQKRRTKERHGSADFELPI